MLSWNLQFTVHSVCFLAHESICIQEACGWELHIDWCVPVCVKLLELLCYHKMSGSVWQKVFNKLKISHLLFYETLLYSPANVALVWCFDIIHEKMPGKHKNKISQYVKLNMHIESTIFSEKYYFLASKCLTEPLAYVLISSAVKSSFSLVACLNT